MTRAPSLILLSLLAVLSGCAKTDEPTATSPAPTTAPGTAPPSTAANGPLSIPDTDAVRGRVITKEDLGADWQEYSPGKQLVVEEKDCARKELTTLTKSIAGTQGAAWAGPTLQRGDVKRYVSSSSLAFPNADAAKAYVLKRKAPDYVECRRAQYASEEAATGSGITYVTEVAADPPGTDGKDGVMTVYQAKTADGGPASGQIARYLWREGANVLTLQQDSVPAVGDPANVNQLVNDEVARAVTAALARAGG